MLPALLHDCLLILEPGTKSQISARFTARRDETPRAPQGVFLGRRAGVRALPTTCARSPCASKFSGTSRRPLVGGGPPPDRNVFRVWHREEEPGWENRHNLFRFGRTLVFIRQLVCTESKIMDKRFRERTAASNRIMVLFVDCEIEHACGFGVDRKLGSSSAQTNAPGNTPRAVARPTQDGRRCLQRLREPDGGRRANRQAIFKKRSQALKTCHYCISVRE